MKNLRFPNIFSDNIDWQLFIMRLRSAPHLQCTQKELALRLGVDQGTVAKWEQGKSFPRWTMRRTLKEVAKGCGFLEDMWPVNPSSKQS